MGYIAVGRILGTRGVGGEVRFRYYNESESTLSRYAAFYAEREGDYVKLAPMRVRLQRGQYMLQFSNVATHGEASSLVGKELFVREEDLPRLSEGEYYDYQLVGLTAVNELNEPIGSVKEVIHTKANDIIVIEGETEMLVPMIEGFILGVDISASSIRVAEGAFVG
jgi:16S rRNA processing protein RimM